MNWERLIYTVLALGVAVATALVPQLQDPIALVPLSGFVGSVIGKEFWQSSTQKAQRRASMAPPAGEP